MNEHHPAEQEIWQLASQGKLPDALLAMQTLIESDPDSRDLHQQMAILEIANGNVDKGTTVLNNLLADQPDDSILFFLANLQWNQGNVNETAAYLARISAQSATAPEHILLQTYVLLEQPEQGAKAAHSYLKGHVPESGAAHNELLEMLLLLQEALNDEAALQTAQQMVSQKSDNLRAYIMVVMDLVRQGDHKALVAQMTKFPKAILDDPQMAAIMHTAFEQAGHDKAAQFWLQQAKRGIPETFETEADIVTWAKSLK